MVDIVWEGRCEGVKLYGKPLQKQRIFGLVAFNKIVALSMTIRNVVRMKTARIKNDKVTDAVKEERTWKEAMWTGLSRHFRQQNDQGGRCEGSPGYPRYD